MKKRENEVTIIIILYSIHDVLMLLQYDNGYAHVHTCIYYDSFLIMYMTYIYAHVPHIPLPYNVHYKNMYWLCP